MTPIRRAGVAGGMILSLLFFGWVFLYLSGLFPYLGYKSMTENFASVFDKPSDLGSSTRRGLNAWQETFVFFKGQEVFIDYSVEVRRGSLWLFVRPWGFGPHVWQEATQERVTASGQGRLRHRIARAGLYNVVARPSNASGPGRGYEITYTATWGATWGAP